MVGFYGSLMPWPYIKSRSHPCLGQKPSKSPPSCNALDDNGFSPSILPSTSSNSMVKSKIAVLPSSFRNLADRPRLHHANHALLCLFPYKGLTISTTTPSRTLIAANYDRSIATINRRVLGKSYVLHTVSNVFAGENLSSIYVC